MNDESKARWRLSMVGWVTLGLGGLDLIRLGAELLAVGDTAKTFYYFVILTDVLLGATAIVVGYLLTHPARRTWALMVALWGVWVGDSVVIFSSMLSHVVPSISGNEFRILLPRMLFYVVVLAVSPWVLWSLLTLEEPERPPRARLWRRLAVGFLAGVLIGVLILSRK